MAVVFDCSSNMAMFRKPYTTTSSVSFAFPPPTAVAGLIAAITGAENGADKRADNAEYWSGLTGTQVAVALQCPIKWLRASINFWNVKNPAKAPHIQVKHQFLSRPKYRIYVKGGIEDALRDRLQRGEFVYTPYLGTAYCITSIEYAGCCEDEEVGGSEIMVNTVLPLADDVELDMSKSKKIFKETVPFKLTQDRGLDTSVTVLYTDNANTLALKKRGSLDVTRCMDETVAWFPEW